MTRLIFASTLLLLQTFALAQNPKRIESQHLPNAVLVHPKVISGGLPADEAAFKELADRGIKMIISVDGMKPDVDLAAKHGLRYVHLPHGYDGVPAARAKELAKAVRDLPGPIYIHCHHGKHRSPAAASVACVTAGMLPRESAVGILEIAGTNPNYRGLYQSARDATPMSKQELDALAVTFHSNEAIPPFAEAMVSLEHTFANVQQIAESNWQSPKDHPDLDPAHESLLLAEHFTEMLRTEWVQSQPSEFRHMLKESESSALTLADLLKQSKNTSPPKTATGHLQRINDNCKACHVQFRDVPLGEK